MNEIYSMYYSTELPHISFVKYRGKGEEVAERVFKEEARRNVGYENLCGPSLKN
jgi:hypothetical protein